MIRLLLNALRMLGANLAAQVLVAIAIVIAARNSDPETLGPIIGLVGLVSLGASIADFGMNSLTVRALASDPSDLQTFTATLSVKLIMGIALGAAWVLLSLAALVIGAPISIIGPTIPLGVYLGAWVISSTLSIPFRAEQRFGPVATGLALERAVLLGATFLLMAALQLGPLGLGIAYMADGLAAMIFFLSLLERRYRVLQRPSGSAMLSLWRSSAMFGLSSVAVQIQKADVAVVAATAGAAASGIYAIPARLTTPVAAVVSSFTTAMYPMVASGRPSARRHALVGSALTLLLTGLALAAAWALADDAVSLLLGPGYADAVPVLRIILVATLIAAGAQPMSTYLQAVRDERFVATVGLLAALGGLMAVGLGAVVGGVVGAAWGTALQQAVISAALLARLIRRSRRGSAGGTRTTAVASASTSPESNVAAG